MKARKEDNSKALEEMSDFFGITEHEILDIATSIGISVAESAMEAQKEFLREVDSVKNPKN